MSALSSVNLLPVIVKELTSYNADYPAPNVENPVGSGVMGMLHRLNDMLRCMPLLFSILSVSALFVAIWVIKDQVKCRSIYDVPTLALGLPFFGHTLYLALLPGLFYSFMRTWLCNVTRRIDMILLKPILITNVNDAYLIFKESKHFHTKPFRIFLNRMMGATTEHRKIIDADTSDLGMPEFFGEGDHAALRFENCMHSLISKAFSGSSLQVYTERLQQNLKRHTLLGSISTEWVEFPDLANFLGIILFESSTRSIFGDEIFHINPQFATDFLCYDRGIAKLLRPYPRWFAPTALHHREVCLATFRRWGHKVRKQQRSNNSPITQYDPVLGSELSQRRHGFFRKLNRFEVEESASEDLALLWGSTANSMHSTFWYVYEILKDQQLLQDFLALIHSGPQHGDADGPTDVQKLASEPLVRSLYAEVLRFYSSGMVFRSPTADFQLRQWMIRKNDVILIPTSAFHFDSRAFPPTPAEGPPRPEASVEQRHAYSSSQLRARRFCDMETREDGRSRSRGFKSPGRAWMPFGGGKNMCPGRRFAQQQTLALTAEMLGSFDIELVGTPVA